MFNQQGTDQPAEEAQAQGNPEQCARPIFTSACSNMLRHLEELGREPFKEVLSPAHFEQGLFDHQVGGRVLGPAAAADQGVQSLRHPSAARAAEDEERDRPDEAGHTDEDQEGQYQRIHRCNS